MPRIVAHGIGDEMSAKPSCWHRERHQTVTTVTQYSIADRSCLGDIESGSG
jgi:hypothetical protein